MTRCCMNGKELRCPVCGSKRVSYYYGTFCTVVFCQNPKRNKKGLPLCTTIGVSSSVTYHWNDPRFGEWIGMAGWNAEPQKLDLSVLKPLQQVRTG